ncbi:MAG: hypothetical protein KAH18_03520 [Psychromonas sp.]|nr:hypothetical protein [Psychromonas sp.]
MLPKNETSETNSMNSIKRNIPPITDWLRLSFSEESSIGKFYVENISIICRSDVALRSIMGIVVINGGDLGSIYLTAC